MTASSETANLEGRSRFAVNEDNLAAITAAGYSVKADSGHLTVTAREG